MAEGERTYDLPEAARFLHMSPAVLRQKARMRQLKAAKPGKAWVFLERDLVAYLDRLYADPRQAPLSGSNVGGTTWESSNAVMSGGSTSLPRMDAEYANLLGLTTSSRRRSYTTD
ncbi:helix-turn-helix domain-containing protein [Nevskia sp.]|uniref:helix-turn-helix domain-containing protein n=1 Tax=Nevskia sp. TaxID=1929292 RepID=UPI00345A0670